MIGASSLVSEGAGAKATVQSLMSTVTSTPESKHASVGKQVPSEPSSSPNTAFSLKSGSLAESMRASLQAPATHVPDSLSTSASQPDSYSSSPKSFTASGPVQSHCIGTRSMAMRSVGMVVTVLFSVRGSSVPSASWRSATILSSTVSFSFSTSHHRQRRRDLLRVIVVRIDDEAVVVARHAVRLHHDFHVGDVVGHAHVGLEREDDLPLLVAGAAG